VLQAEMQELNRLKADIFQSNLSVHRLLSRDDLSGVDISALKAAREDVVRLYALWADASAALGGRKEAELRQRLADIGGHQRAMSHSSESLRKGMTDIGGENFEAADISGQNVTTKAKGPRQRRRRRKPRPTTERGCVVARSFDSPCPEDSGYSETASRNDNVEACGGNGRLQTAEALEVAAEMPKKKAAVKTGGGGGGVGWLGRVGRAALYSCLLAAALLPLAMYQAQPPQCCEFMYPTPHWIHFQYVNGPPPI
jgi:hypothetical protein